MSPVIAEELFKEIEDMGDLGDLEQVKLCECMCVYVCVCECMYVCV